MRHGQTDWNKERRIQGTLDIGLNDAGKRQVREACGSLLNRKYTKIISSPLRRARESAAICSEILGISVALSPYFAERSFGMLQGMTIPEILERFGIADVEAIFDDSTFNVESIPQVRHRVRTGMEEVRRLFPGEEVLVVTHGSIIKSVLLELGQHAEIIGNAGFAAVDA